MAKYSPKENTYKEMYLINKFEKDIMENSLQNMRNDQNKTTQKIITTNDISPVKEKEEIENSNKKKTESEKGDQNQISNEKGIPDIPEVLNSSIEKEQINDISLSDNGNTPEQRVYTETTPQGIKRKEVKTKKSITPVIENTSRKNLKGRKKYQLQQEKKYLSMKYFKIGNYNYLVILIIINFKSFSQYPIPIKAVFYIQKEIIALF